MFCVLPLAASRFLHAFLIILSSEHVADDELRKTYYSRAIYLRIAIIQFIRRIGRIYLSYYLTQFDLLILHYSQPGPTLPKERGSVQASSDTEVLEVQATSNSDGAWEPMATTISLAASG